LFGFPEQVLSNHNNVGFYFVVQRSYLNALARRDSKQRSWCKLGYNFTSNIQKGRDMYKYLRAGLMAVFIGLAGCSDAAKSPLAAVKINTLDQQVVDFAQLKDQGKVTVVNFWATDCSTCKKEMPRMVEMYGTYQPKGLEYVGIAMAHDKVSYIQNYAAAQKLPFKLAWDENGQLAQQFGGIIGTPTTFIIGKDGQVIKRIIGEPKWPEFYAALDDALGA
jgi:peroxiredoxin